MRVGEMVVCVWSGTWQVWNNDRCGQSPIVNEVYQVLGIHIFDDDKDTLYLSIDLDSDTLYQAAAFRPVAYGPLPARKIKQPV